MSSGRPTWAVGDIDVDLAAPEFYTTDRCLEVWREARRRHPVAWAESATVGGFWSVTTHDLGSRVVKQPRSFTSTSGMRLGGNPKAVARASGKMLVVADGDDHRWLRSVHASWFTSGAVNMLRPAVEGDVEDLLRGLVGRGAPFDAVREFAGVVPRRVLCRMMGVPGQDWDELADLTDTAFGDGDEDTAAAAHAEIFMYFSDLLEVRRERPGDDIVTALSQANVGGRRLSDEEIILNCDGLMNGGLETTPHAVVGAILAFAADPESWQRVRTVPRLLDSAVEEILRWTSPPMHVMRTAVHDTSLGVARIREGDRVVVWIPSCNRDENVFPDAERFLVDRAPNPHLSFGGGPHYCVGATLARLELRCILKVMSRLVSSFEIASTGRLARKRSNFLHGIDHLDVMVVPADH